MIASGIIGTTKKNPYFMPVSRVLYFFFLIYFFEKNNKIHVSGRYDGWILGCSDFDSMIRAEKQKEEKQKRVFKYIGLNKSPMIKYYKEIICINELYCQSRSGFHFEFLTQCVKLSKS